ncbi:MAG: heme exporter protein CcmD [Maritimibacter sp.]|nr:heme exporter protein CcmD [Maritimibacter sp.]
MPELGKYAGAVLGSWAITLALLAVLIALTWARARSAKRKHDEIEARRHAANRAGEAAK